MTARRLDGIDEAKLLGEVKQIEGDTRRLTASEFTALEETGIARPEIEFDQLGLPPADEDERAV